MNTGDGYAYIYSNVGAGAPNTADGHAYSYVNVGADSHNSGDGVGYSYENVMLYVITTTDGMPPTIN